jgi:thioredoxin reductase (NADPH)
VRYITDNEGEVCGLVVRNVKSGQEAELAVKCVFVAIGHTPNTAPFVGKIDMDEHGYLRQVSGTRTNVPGVFAAGDVADPVYRQAITAAGQGCAAAIEAERWLAEHGLA